MTAFWTPLAMVMVYEFRMQWRRRAMWLAMIAVGGAFPLLAWQTLNARFAHESVARAVADWANFLNIWIPLAFGMVLADRIPRDRRLHIDDLFDSLPACLGSRLWGKALGAAAATTVPVLLIALAGSGDIALRLHAPSAIALGAAAILTINLPALLFLTTVCLLLSALIWTPAVGFICAGLWLWLQLDPSQAPSLSNSLLSPTGSYAIAGLFGSDRGWAGSRGLVDLGPLMPRVSVASGVLSVLLIVGMAAALLSALPPLARCRQER